MALTKRRKKRVRVNRSGPKLYRYRAKMTGNSRIVAMEGREYFVFPVVILVEGVHAGSTGPIFYAGEDLDLFASSWNHKPVVINHPRRNGFYVSADDPQILTDSKVGVLMNTRMIGSKLYSEAWLERERIEDLAPSVLKSLKRGETVEVSTGLFSSLQLKKGIWHNEKYYGIARDYRPDHLAILPTNTGACSVKDGCGMTAACSCQKGKTMKTKRTTLKARLAKKKLVDALIASEDWSSTDRRTLMALETEKLKKLVALNDEDEDDDDEDEVPARKKTVKKTSVKANKRKTEDDEENEEEDEAPRRNRLKTKKKTTANSEMAEVNTFLKKAPKSIGAILRHGLSAHNETRSRYIDIILSNEDNQFEEDELETFDLKMLNKLASLAVRDEEEEEEEADVFNYEGLSGPPTRRGKKDEVEALEMEEMDFADEKKDKDKE